MKQKIIDLVEKKILAEMYVDEKNLKTMLDTETGDVPAEQLDALLVRIQQLLGKVAINQDKIILLQDITNDKV
jgi:hypothetical protein